MTTSLLINLTLPVCLGVGFFAGYVLNRSRTWGSAVCNVAKAFLTLDTELEKVPAGE